MTAVCLCTRPDETTLWFTVHRIILVCSQVTPLACFELFDQHDTKCSAVKFFYIGMQLTFKPKGKSLRYPLQIFPWAHKSMQTTSLRLWSHSQQFGGIRNFPFSNPLNQRLKTHDSYLNVTFFKNLVSCWQLFETDSILHLFPQWGLSNDCTTPSGRGVGANHQHCGGDTPGLRCLWALCHVWFVISSSVVQTAKRDFFFFFFFFLDNCFGLLQLYLIEILGGKSGRERWHPTKGQGSDSNPGHCDKDSALMVHAQWATGAPQGPFYWDGWS